MIQSLVESGVEKSPWREFAEYYFAGTPTLDRVRIRLESV